MSRSSGFGSRLQTPTPGGVRRQVGAELPQGGFQSISASRRAEAQCRLPPPRPPAPPPPPPMPVIAEEEDAEDADSRLIIPPLDDE